MCTTGCARKSIYFAPVPLSLFTSPFQSLFFCNVMITKEYTASTLNKVNGHTKEKWAGTHRKIVRKVDGELLLGPRVVFTQNAVFIQKCRFFPKMTFSFKMSFWMKKMFCPHVPLHHSFFFLFFSKEQSLIKNYSLHKTLSAISQNTIFAKTMKLIMKQKFTFF